jgi:16S rRNA (cytosine967-C5)-methyltransferase
MPRSSDARAVAWEILQRVEEGAFADALLGRAHNLGLQPRDQSLLTRIVYGTLAWQGYLDHLLTVLSNRSPHALDGPIRVLLRMGLFQMTKLTRIPVFAAVDTAVELSKQYRKGAGRGLVNAVLRRAAREWESVPLPAAADDLATHLSVRLSHPRWLVERWLAELGAEATEALLSADNEEAPTVLRANLMRCTRDQAINELRAAGYAAEPTRWSPAGIRIDPGGAPPAIPGYGEGRVSVQGEASQLIALLAGVRAGDRVLDACAAPGGKATHLAELMGDTGVVIAIDPNQKGVERVGAMAQRLGLGIVKARRADGTTWEPTAGEPAEVDCALVDAPCTGLGTLRSHPEIRWRRTPDDAARAATLQLRILSRAARYVRPHGALIYATCTLTHEENDGVVAAFLSQSSDFVIDDPRPLLPEAARQLIGDDLLLRTLPSVHGVDGFFGARLKRRSRTGIVSS